MASHASALVLAMIDRSLAAQRLARPAPAPAGRDRLVPLARKRALLQSVLAEHGPAAILRVGEVVGEFADHPVATVLARAGSGRQLIERWQAIEGYFHSRHRTRVLAHGPAGVEMEHVDTRGRGTIPAENLVVAGMVVGALRWRGADGLQLRIGGWMVGDGQETPPPAGLGPTDRWTITWERFAARDAGCADPPPPPAVDHIGRRLEDPLVRRLFVEALAAPDRRADPARCARGQNTSARTLQRRLQSAGWSLQDLVMAARVQTAARLLRETELPLAFVGLLAGYSDQPHFQRSFRRAVGPTPKVYRALAAGQPSALW